MNTYNTGNPLGSTAVKDLYDNASNFDEGFNGPSPSFLDRFGKRRQSWSGMEQAVQDFLVSAGYVFLANYTASVVITARNQYVVRAGEAYVIADSVAVPYTITGDWATEQIKFKLLSDTALRSELAASNGATLIGFGSGTVADALAGQLPLRNSVAAMANGPIGVTALFLNNGKSSGHFRLLNWADVTSIGAADTTSGFVVRSTVDTSKAWLRDTDYVTPEFFGAAGDGATNDVAAFRLMFSVAKAGSFKIKMAKATYLWSINATEVWDFTSVYATGLQIEGAGPADTTIHIVPVGFAPGTVAWRVQANADWYRLGMKTLSVVGSFDGVLFAVGQDSLVDPLNIAEFDRVEVRNSFAAGTATEAWRLNYVVNSIFSGCIGNCYANGAGTNYGTALRIRQASFNTFVNGSYGNAAYAVRFTDATSYGNVFLGCDHENMSFGLAVQSGTAVRNTWIGGTFSLWTSYALSSSNSDATASTVVKNANFNNGAGPSVIVDPSNFTGIAMQDGLPVTTPSVPASGSAIANTTGKTVKVRIWAGAYSVINIAGVAMSKTSNGDATEWTLPAGAAIALAYSSVPNWSWIGPN